MPEAPAAIKAALDVISPDNSRRRVRLTEFPFFIGRGEAGNDLSIPDTRISQQCAAIMQDGNLYFLEDRGHHRGVFINQKKIARRELEEGDIITFGLDNSFTLIFRLLEGEPEAVAKAPARTEGMEAIEAMEGMAGTDDSPAGLQKLNILLEATRLLHSNLPLESILEAMLDRAIKVTDADRGLLLEADAKGSLRHRLARRRGSGKLAPEEVSPSQTAVSMALKQHAGVITADMHEADGALQSAKSVVVQRLRAVVAIPLYSMPRAQTSGATVRLQRGLFLGVLYLDSQRPAAFTMLDRQILDAIASESANILDNARLVERERERQRIDQELSIARDIQQALLPRKIRDFPQLTIYGKNYPCHACGGDYFDIFPIDEQRTAFLVADVSGKGLGAALMATMLQGALSGTAIGAEPVRVFQHVNNFLVEHEEVGRYATLFFGVLDQDGNLEYLNAGHPSPLLLRRGEVSELYTEGSYPVGLLPNVEFTPARSTLEPGDTLVLFSDGVTEAMDIHEQEFGVSRLQEAMEGQHDAPLDQLQQRIYAAVEQFATGTDQGDDITLLLVRRNGQVAGP
jgi:serine phosphatase RsbU (regulator of sigma subunit)/pSer/pThr/pTyr-binding forkhead associated (FHA) protein